MKVYELVVFDCIEGITSLATKIFGDKERAVSAYKEASEEAIADAEESLDDDEIVVKKTDIDNPKRFYQSTDVYKDGYANDWEVEVRLEEKEIE